MFQLLLAWGGDAAGGRGKDCNIAKRAVYRGKPLGSWLHRQLQHHNPRAVSKDKLQHHQEQKLQQLVDQGQLRWGGEDKEAKWDEKFNELLAWGGDAAGGRGKGCNGWVQGQQEAEPVAGDAA